MKNAPYGYYFLGPRALLIVVICLLAPFIRPVHAASVGVVTFSVGQVMRLPAGSVSQPPAPLAKDAQVFVGDTVITGPGSHAHLRFIDGGLVSVRDSSALVITDYQFNPARPEDSRVRFDLQSGVARSITGQAGRSARHQFRLNTPVAALGVRGTDFAAFSDSKESVFTVNSGVVVVSALGAGCDRDALGPCVGPNALELTKLGTHTARVTPNFERPQPVPAVPDALRQAKSTSRGEPVHANGDSSNNNPELGAGAASQANSSGTLNEGEKPMGSTVMAGSAKPGPDAVAPAPESITASKPDRLGIQEVVAAKVLEPSALAPSIEPLLAWGHWAKANNWAQQHHPPASQVLQSYQIAVGNADVGLFRSPVQAAELPQQGLVRFSLASAQVGLVGAPFAAPGLVQQSALEVNFGSRSFTTSLSGSQPDVGPFQLQASGSVGSPGSSPGVFLSNPERSNARVVGALSSGAGQAGYFFEQAVSPGNVLTGTTLWRQ